VPHIQEEMPLEIGVLFDLGKDREESAETLNF